MSLCGYSIAKTHCHSCSSVDLTTKGFGTEQIQQELISLFQNTKSLEWIKRNLARRIIDSFKIEKF
jgi:primosomal protein N'